MLTRIFATSKPSNFLWVSGYLLSLYVGRVVTSGLTGYTLTQGLMDALFAILLIFSVLLVDFIVRKNDLSKKNSFVIFCYACFLGLMPIQEMVPKLFIAHLLILLALRRLISLPSNREIKKKIFDASLWIALASLLYVWSHGFLVLVFVGVLFFASSDYRNWLVPFFGIATCAVFTVVIGLLVDNQLPNVAQWWQWPDLDYLPMLAPEYYLPAGVILLLSLGFGLTYFSIKRKLVFKTRRVPMFVLACLWVALALALTGTKQTLATWVFVAFPLAIVVSFILEQHQKKYIVELLLWVLLLLPWIGIFVF